MNSQRDGENQGSMVDFAVQLQVMVIVLLFAALWWFESRLDKIEAKANQAAESVLRVEEIIGPFLEDQTSWQQSKPLLKEHLDQ